MACYYIEGIVLLGTKPLMDFIHHFIRDPDHETKMMLVDNFAKLAGLHQLLHLPSSIYYAFKTNNFSSWEALVLWFLASRVQPAYLQNKSFQNEQNFKTPWSFPNAFESL